ncbi:MAG: hypothetical protein A2W91_14060 [Bacteroidetes bacterium GWF2_38_335]|nr:MAG: hypothetical protein A2W91_14060 [Bacteroidetes bacterium GWF2_38_335]OFY77839.1 MAG: hypothetical protein A2281_15750 [Bacteroidetes bacterium RIFOXYA12_FULL_38_20]HBS87353.1 hypothetical protein [Bacteroidales bacterium]
MSNTFTLFVLVDGFSEEDDQIISENELNNPIEESDRLFKALATSRPSPSADTMKKIFEYAKW